VKLSRVIVGGVLIEVATILLRSLGITAYSRFGPQEPGHEVDGLVVAFFVETIGTSIFAIVFGWWATRTNESKFLLSGVLVGLISIVALLVDCLVCQVPFRTVMMPMLLLGSTRIPFALIGSCVSYARFRLRIKRKLP